jgi:hypothetical protein
MAALRICEYQLVIFARFGVRCARPARIFRALLHSLWVLQNIPLTRRAPLRAAVLSEVELVIKKTTGWTQAEIGSLRKFETAKI